MKCTACDPNQKICDVRITKDIFGKVTACMHFGPNSETYGELESTERDKVSILLLRLSKALYESAISNNELEKLK